MSFKSRGGEGRENGIYDPGYSQQLAYQHTGAAQILFDKVLEKELISKIREIQSATGTQRRETKIRWGKSQRLPCGRNDVDKEYSRQREKHMQILEKRQSSPCQRPESRAVIDAQRSPAARKETNLPGSIGTIS